MLFHKFLRIIDKSFIGRFIDGRASVLKELDPKRIYVENIRRFFGINTKFARFLCEMAVKQNIFKKKIGVYCPQCGRMIKEFDVNIELPETIHCDTCEALENEKYEFNKGEFQKMEFYQLNEAVSIPNKPVLK